MGSEKEKDLIFSVQPWVLQWHFSIQHDIKRIDTKYIMFRTNPCNLKTNWMISTSVLWIVTDHNTCLLRCTCLQKAQFYSTLHDIKLIMSSFVITIVEKVIFWAITLWLCHDKTDISQRPENWSDSDVICQFHSSFICLFIHLSDTDTSHATHVY